MEIENISQNKFLDMDKSYKVSDNVKVSKPVEINDAIRGKENSEKDIKNAVNKINKLLEGEGTHLQYEKHEVFNEIIVKVIDNNTREVMNEFPSKKVLDLVAKLCEMAGVLVDKKA